MARKKTVNDKARQFIPCFVKQLPEPKRVEAARVAVDVNPSNSPPIGFLARIVEALTGKPKKASAEVVEPAHLALLTTKYWGTGGIKLGVYFMDTNSRDLKARILQHMNAWQQSANVSFSEASNQLAQVRIARQPGGGYWSYLGTDVLQIPSGQPTMNLEGFDLNVSESEYHRVVRHETGHTMGFTHEHLRRELVERLDPAKTIAYFERWQGWSEAEVRAQVLTPAEEATLTATPHADQMSVMCYQISGECTRDGNPIVGGLDIDQADFDLAAKLYPKAPAPPPPPPPPSGGARVFGLTFRPGVRRGQTVRIAPFRAPADIPAGEYDVVTHAAASQAQEDGEAQAVP